MNIEWNEKFRYSWYLSGIVGSGLGDISSKRTEFILTLFSDYSLFVTTRNDKEWIINCPNILKRLDNWTKRSVVTTKQLPNQQELRSKKEKKEQDIASPKTANPDIKIFTDYWNNTYKLVFNTTYSFTGKDFGLIKTMLSTKSLAEISGLAQKFLNSKDDFVLELLDHLVHLFCRIVYHLKFPFIMDFCLSRFL